MHARCVNSLLTSFSMGRPLLPSECTLSHVAYTLLNLRSPSPATPLSLHHAHPSGCGCRLMVRPLERAGADMGGGEAALVSSETTAPLSPKKKNAFPGSLGVAERAPHLLPEPAPFIHPQPDGWATNPPLHVWRVPFSKGEHMRTPRSTCRHSPPPPPRVQRTIKSYKTIRSEQECSLDTPFGTQ